MDDKLDYHQVLQAKSKILLKTPWNSTPSDQIMLKPGENIFWLTEAPAEPMSIEDTTVENVLMPPLTFASFQVLMKEIQSQVMNQLKVLKVVGTTKADVEIAKVVEYFKETEEKLIKSDLDTIANQERLEPPKQATVDRQPISKALNVIACDQVEGLNSLQKAEYLKGDVNEQTLLDESFEFIDIFDLDSESQQLDSEEATSEAEPPSSEDEAEPPTSEDETEPPSRKIEANPLANLEDTGYFSNSLNSASADDTLTMLNTAIQKLKEICTLNVESETNRIAREEVENRFNNALQTVKGINSKIAVDFVKKNYFWIIIPVATIAVYKILRH
jgi:hypothetical protein